MLIAYHAIEVRRSPTRTYHLPSPPSQRAKQKLHHPHHDLITLPTRTLNLLEPRIHQQKNQTPNRALENPLSHEFLSVRRYRAGLTGIDRLRVGSRARTIIVSLVTCPDTFLAVSNVVRSVLDRNTLGQLSEEVLTTVSVRIREDGLARMGLYRA